MAFLSQNSKEYTTAINSLKKPGYTSKYQGQLDNVLDKILNREDFKYDISNDPMYAQYKNEYVNLGKQAVANAVASTSALTGGYGNSYSATAASQANQQYITQMNNAIPQLMEAAMKRYQMEQDNVINQFGALQSAENMNYQQYRDSVSDYYKDYSNLESGYSKALNQENILANRAYEAERDKVSDSQWNDKFNYQKERDLVSDEQWKENQAYKAARDAVSDSQWNEKLEYKKARDLVSDEQWQKEWDLKQLQQAAKKASKSTSGGKKVKTTEEDNTDNSFFKLKGTAALKTYSGNKVETTRNATLSLTKRNQLMNELLAAGSDSKAQKILNQWAYDGRISEGDYDILADLYNKAKEKNIKQFTVNGKK